MSNFTSIYQKITQRTFPKRAVKNILINQALDCVGNPQHTYKTIHVAGTNGKGSVCNFIYNFLKTKFKTAIFTSPSLTFDLEWAKVNDSYISEQEFVDIYQQNLSIIKHFKLSFFEIKTLIAYIYFKNQNVDYAVIETGLGGQNDATNNLQPKACVITNVGDDHQEFIGKTLALRAKAKLGIQKPNVKLFTSEKRLLKYSKWPQNIIVCNKHFINLTHLPSYQKSNYNIAFLLLIYLGFDKNNIARVFAQTKALRWRFEIKNNIIFDGAHNVHAIKALLSSLQSKEKYNFVFSSLENKNYQQMIKLLSQKGQVYLMSFTKFNKKSFDAKTYALKNNLAFIENIKEIKKLQGKIIFTGSFYFLASIYDMV